MVEAKNYSTTTTLELEDKFHKIDTFASLRVIKFELKSIEKEIQSC